MFKLRTAVDSANDAVIIANQGADGAPPTIEYVNAAFEGLYGYRAAEVIGKSLDMLHVDGAVGSGARRVADAMAAPDGYRKEHVDRTRDGAAIATEWRLNAVRNDCGVITHWVGIIRDMADKHRYEKALKESERRALNQLAELETLYHAAPIGLAMFSTDLRYMRINERLAEIDGVPLSEHLGRTPREIIPVLADQAEKLMRQVLQSGEPVLPIEIEWEPPEVPGDRRTWREQFYPVLVDGVIEGVGAVIEDITEQRRAETHLRFVMRELNHRVKNSLAVVQSMASQTVRASSTLAEFEEALIGRIRALANTHTLLTESNWHCADLRDVVRGAVRPYCRVANCEDVDIQGPQISLTPSAALAFSMVLHELTTNAAKYGALSSSDGRISVHWSLVDGLDGCRLVLNWAESGGPLLEPPRRTGFGSRLIDFTIAHEFGGKATIDHRRHGIACQIVIPWNNRTESKPG
ncbi:MAG: PAS domain-containing protein [Rhodospirillales bacterium]|nr:PAS domain-containing protein [Rhodospirillales bacterium]